MDWLAYETQNLAFKIKDQITIESKHHEAFFLTILRHEKANDFTFLTTLHSVTRLQNQEYVFTQEFLLSVLELVEEF